jgi:hypothetical protein
LQDVAEAVRRRDCAAMGLAATATPGDVDDEDHAACKKKRVAAVVDGTARLRDVVRRQPAADRPRPASGSTSTR